MRLRTRHHQLPFIPTLYKDDDGREVLIFNASDKESVVAKYYVKEAKYRLLLPFTDWQESDGRYVLKYPSDSTNIKMKAIDQAGNERIVEFPSESREFIWYLVLIPFFAGGLIFWWRAVYLRKKQL
jgi:hypothetical protein